MRAARSATGGGSMPARSRWISAARSLICWISAVSAALTRWMAAATRAAGMRRRGFTGAPPRSLRPRPARRPLELGAGPPQVLGLSLAESRPTTHIRLTCTGHTDQLLAPPAQEGAARQEHRTEDTGKGGPGAEIPFPPYSRERGTEFPSGSSCQTVPPKRWVRGGPPPQGPPPQIPFPKGPIFQIPFPKAGTAFPQY